MNIPIKKKGINLFMITFAILLIIVLIILAIYFFTANNSNENSKEISMQISVDTDNSTSNEIENMSNFSNILNEGTLENSVVESTSENIISDANIINNTTSSDDLATFNINNHTFKISSSKNASFVMDSNKNALQLMYADYKIIFNTDASVTYEELQNMDSLKDYLETSFNFTITSDMRTGNLNNLDVIIFEMSDSNGIGYCIISPLTDSEIAYAKIFNTTDSASLVSDLSNPISEIIDIISGLSD